MKVTLLFLALFLFSMIKTHFFSFNPSLNRRSSALVSTLFAGPLFPHHTSFLSFLINISCGLNSPVHGQVYKPYIWEVFSMPSLNLEKAFLPTSSARIHSWSEGCSNLVKFKSNMVLVRWRLTQPFRVPSTTFSLSIVVSLSTSSS
jgi:hypothetical protein